MVGSARATGWPDAAPAAAEDEAGADFDADSAAAGDDAEVGAAEAALVLLAGAAAPEEAGAEEDTPGVDPPVQALRDRAAMAATDRVARRFKVFSQVK
ncbi:hypothetical protein DWB68_00255 [Galactobacter valiniphilus]|uniref:Uncharacterized protein n=1 Tax=Galactobacter valiniphilus TaxID=2676122 RepID=A0A399JGB2_9MICC|nr:hypothetical protein DWB68_00255 [Galactobacter valiniphilus]